MRRLVAVAGCLSLAGCATPNTIRPEIARSDAFEEAARELEYAAKVRIAEGQRLEDVAFRLEVANSDLCPTKRARVGADFANADTFEPQIRNVEVRLLNLGYSLQVTHVIPHSPAAEAGVQVGDELVSLNGVAAPGGPKARERLSAQFIEALARNPSRATLVVRRAGQTQTIDLTPVLACDYDVQIADTSQELNAWADGKHIFVTRPMMKLAVTDEELALVVAHELAHNAKGHMNAKMRNSGLAGLGGAALDILAAAGGVNTGGAFTKAAMKAGANYSSPEFEAEADYVGMYFLARAGYQTDGVENFWREMAVEHPQAIFVKTDHPTTPSRFLAIAATNQEIAKKRTAGAAILPNEKTK